MDRRKFTLLDAMVVIAGLAVAIAWTRLIMPFIRGNVTLHFDFLHMDLWRARWMIWPTLSVPWMAMGSLVLLILRIGRPRPPWPELFRQPGTAASLAVSAILVFQMGMLGLVRSIAQIRSLFPTAAMNAPDLGDRIWSITYDLNASGETVLAAWLVLALGGLWAAEPSWIDRAGRGLGIAWLVRLVMDRGGLYDLSW